MGIQNSKNTTKKRNNSLREASSRPNVLVTKTTPINNEYILSEKRFLGKGVNGNVLLCQHKTTKQKYALKVIFYLFLIFA